MAPSPSGKARVCKTLITSSNLVGASNLSFRKKSPTFWPRWDKLICRCGEMADAQDLKSWVRNRTCRFDPDHRHHIIPYFIGDFLMSVGSKSFRSKIVQKSSFWQKSWVKSWVKTLGINLYKDLVCPFWLSKGLNEYKCR